MNAPNWGRKPPRQEGVWGHQQQLKEKAIFRVQKSCIIWKQKHMVQVIYSQISFQIYLLYSNNNSMINPNQHQSSGQGYLESSEGKRRENLSFMSTSIPGWGRSPGEGSGNPLQHSCLENPKDRGAWRATVPAVAKNQIRLSE